MRPKHWHLATAAAAALILVAADLPARVSETAGRPSTAAPAGVATLQHDPQFILEAVARRMGITLRPALAPPAIRLESRTPLRRLQAAAERQWGVRPHVFTTTYASAGNEIYLIDDAALCAQYGGTPDDSLAHELVHYLQATYLRDRFNSDWSEAEAVATQTRGRSPRRTRSSRRSTTRSASTRRKSSRPSASCSRRIRSRRTTTSRRPSRARRLPRRSDEGRGGARTRSRTPLGRAAGALVARQQARSAA